MPAPSFVPALLDIPLLPSRLHILAAGCLSNPASSSDHVLLLADACEEMSPYLSTGTVRSAVRMLAAELRRRAPEYA